MDSFKVYLPSNSCPTLFPQNTATDYRTRFDKAINLDGQWEVGVESISYSSHINDEKERANVNFFIKSKHPVPINNMYEFEFITTDQRKWKGYDGITPSRFETNTSQIESILNTLNGMNRQMLNSQKLAIYGRVFEFYLNKKNYVEYRGNDMGFALQLTNRLAQVLGFAYRTVFNGKGPIIAAGKPEVDSKTSLKEDDYLLRYMSKANQTMKTRITLKPKGKSIEGKSIDEKQQAFLVLWKKHVTPVTDTRAEFKSGKLILHNYRNDFGLSFSDGFAHTFAMSKPFFGKGSRWASNTSLLDSYHENREWYIDIYDTTLELSYISKYQDLSVSFYPWRCKSMKQVISLVNSQVEKLLRDSLTNVYDVKKHHFQLSLEQNDHTKLVLGTWIGKCLFSPNLSFLLGFSSEVIEDKETLGVREVDSLENHSRQLHLLSNVIKPTAYGKQQRQILCDFLHERSALPIIEKRFDPISYHPVAQNSIDLLYMQLTDDNYNPSLFKTLPRLLLFTSDEQSENTHVL